MKPSEKAIAIGFACIGLVALLADAIILITENP